MEGSDGIDRTASPLDDPQHWTRMVNAVGQTWLLVAIGSWIGRRNRLEREDVLQEGLLHAWSNRARFKGRGVRAFRSWLLQIIRVRFWGLLDRQPIHPPQQLPREADLPPATTTAEGMASWHDQCESMSRALAGLPEDLREVVRLRLFEELAMPRIAERLGIGLSMARYRWRKGAESVRHALGGPHR